MHDGQSAKRIHTDLVKANAALEECHAVRLLQKPRISTAHGALLKTFSPSFFTSLQKNGVH